MKKLLILSSFLVFGIISFAQFPNTQNPISNPQTIYQIWNLRPIKSFMVPVEDTLNNQATPYLGAVTILPSDSAAGNPIVYITNGVFWELWQGSGGGGGGEIGAEDTLFVTDDLYVVIDDLGRQVLHNYTEYIDVRRFGVVCDWNGSTGTDNLAAINLAFDYAETLANYSGAVAGVHYVPTLYVPTGGGFYVSDSVSLGKGVSLIMESPLISGVDITKTALTIGSTATRTYQAKFRIMVKKVVQSDWTDSASVTSIGVRMYNMSNCDIEIANTTSFTIGVDFVGVVTGFTDNRVVFGVLAANKYGQRNFSKSPTGYVNENVYTGGQFAVTGVNPGKARYGVWQTSDYAYYGNQNIWIKPSFQMTASQGGEAIPFLMEYSNNNAVYNLRSEGNSEYVARIKNNSTENRFNDGYTFMILDDQSTGKTNYVRGGTQGLDPGYQIYNSGPLHKLASQYTATTVHIPGINTVTSSGSLINRNSSTWFIHPNYLYSTGSGTYMGVFMNTERCKRFVVRKDTDSGHGGRLYIACYDINGNIMTSSHPNAPLVRGQNLGNAWTFSSSALGGSYSAGSDVDGDMYFVVDTAVHKVRLMFAASTGLRIRSFEIYALSFKEKSLGATVFSGYDETTKRNLATTVPTVGTYERSKLVWNDAPTAGNPIFWVNTVAGTFGTLTAITGDISSGSVLLTVNDVSTLQEGQFINIAGVTGTKTIRAINGLVVTIHASADATVDDAAISYQTPSFQAVEGGEAVPSFVTFDEVNLRVGINNTTPGTSLTVGAGTTSLTVHDGVGVLQAGQISNNVTSGFSGIVAGVSNANSRRIGIWVDETNGIAGISSTYGVGGLPFVIRTAGEVMRMSGLLTGWGVTTPLATHHIKAGTTAVSQIILDPGLRLTVPKIGAIENDTTGSVNHLYWTDFTGTRWQLDQQSGGTYTADNGLTMAANNVKLGGTALSGNTDIPTSAFTLTMTSSHATATINSTNTNSGGAALRGNHTDGTGVRGSVTTGTGVVGVATSGTGVAGSVTTGGAIDGLATTGTPGIFTASPTTTNTVVPILKLNRIVSGGSGANGVGGSIQFLNELDAGGSTPVANTIESKVTDATVATYTSQLDITGVNNAATETFANFQTGGIIRTNNNADTVATLQDVRDGTATNDNAGAGDIGEEVNAIISTYTNYTTSATYQNVTSIILTAGDWDISAFMTYSSNSSTITAAANAIFVISTTTASAAGATEGKNIVYIPQAALLGTSLFSDGITPYRVSISGTTTYYLNTQATFTLGNPQYVASIRARRSR